jgi:hypothetical protein
MSAASTPQPPSRRRALLAATGCLAAIAALPATAGAAPPAAKILDRGQPPAAAAAAPSPYTFAGVSAQFPCQMSTENLFCGNVNVDMARDMKRVKRVLIGYEETCQQPDKYVGANMMVTGIKAKRGARGSSFSAAAQGTDDLGGGLTAKTDVRVSGKVKQGAAGGGSFTISTGIFDASGKQIDSCTTNAVPYTLKALKKH